MFLHGERFVVDAGTCSYDADAARVVSRSTAAHNTVVVNGLDQSEVWGSFRVGRRSNPTLSKAGCSSECLIFQGEYSNRVDTRQGITHERIIVIKPSRWLLVLDTIEAHGTIEARSYCHFAPKWKIAKASGGFCVHHDEHDAVHCYPIRVDKMSVLESQHAPEFGKAVPTQALSFLATGQRHVETGYLLAATDVADGASIEVVRKGNRLDIRINQTQERIDLGRLAL